jgi:hypothetical protein
MLDKLIKLATISTHIETILNKRPLKTLDKAQELACRNMLFKVDGIFVKLLQELSVDKDVNNILAGKQASYEVGKVAAPKKKLETKIKKTNV